MNRELERLSRFKVSNGEIVRVSYEKETKEGGAFTSAIAQGGKHYEAELLLKPSAVSHVRVLVWLPEKENWNGKFFGTGNGGYAGSINTGTMVNALSRGYATANTDMGTGPDVDAFIGEEEIWKDFGYRATHVMTTVSKELVEYFYGIPPKHSYFLGGSTGGQQALSEAQRYPLDYDGIIAMSPAYDRIRLHAWFVYTWQCIHKNPGATFTEKEALRWNQCLVKHYRSFCGGKEEDPYLTFPDMIRENPMENRELAAEAETFLNAAQREALRELYSEFTDPVTGDKIIAHFLPGSESENLGLVSISDKEKFAKEFFYPFRWIFGKDFDFMRFDFHRDLPKAIERLSPVMDATDPDLSAFREAGGKLLLIGGSSDPIIPYPGYMDYLEKAAAVMGGAGNVKTFVRFFLMPGLAHIFGGKGVTDCGVVGLKAVKRDPEHDVICAMEQWAEKGIAPERMTGTRLKMTLTGPRHEEEIEAGLYPWE